MTEVQPIALNTAIGANQQTLVDSPIFRSLYRDMTANQNVKPSATRTLQDTNYQLLPPELSNVPLINMPKGRRFTAQQIAQLIYKVSPQGVTLTALRAYPSSDLTPLQRQIRDYFVSTPIVFEALAKLDSNTKTLSNQDIQVASQIVKNINVTAPPAQNTQQLRQPPAPNIPQQQAEPTTQQPLTSPQQPAVQPQTVPTPIAPPTTQLPQPPQFNPNIAQPLPPQTNNNIARTDLSRNEQVRAYAGYNAMPARRKRRGDDVESPDIDTVHIDDPETIFPIFAPSLSYVKPFFIYTEKIELDANEVKELFEKIAGKNKKLTLFNIRNYEPSNAKEEKIISVLKHLNVYKELSHINHHEDLELEDIEIATDGKDFVFSDGRLDLIIHSSINAS